MYKIIASNNVIPVSFRMRQCETFTAPHATSTVWRLGVSSAPEKPRWVLIGLQTVNLETYYSFANIRKGNNSFKWSIDEGKTWTLLHIPTGCYELKAINASWE